MAAVELDAVLEITWRVVKVALGLGFVIFVHELGHFLVAKLCGVKCEKFYVGFDIPIKLGPIELPSRLGRFQWGETEYGIGILPLGGYVKMLGQDDDPRMAQQEAERIRVRKEAAEAGDGTQKDEAGEYELDPRSFPAKPVPYRMAIISAGVIMNLIFAVIFATYAFSVGVPFTPTEVGGTVPGSPAWQAGLQRRARIIQIGENGQRSEKLRFDWDLSNGGVGLAQDQEDLPLLLRGPDGEETRYAIRPKMTQKAKAKIPMIGVAPAKTLTIVDSVWHSSSDTMTPPLKSKDKIVAVDGQPVTDAYTFEEILAQQPDDDLRITVERPVSKDSDEVESVELVVPPNPLKRLGLVMEYGPITGIRPGSPAESAGFQIGDRLELIDGQPLGDPMVLPATLRQYYGQPVTVQVRRAGQTVDLEVTPAQPETLDWMISAGFPMAAEALGIAFDVTEKVDSVAVDSPAAGAIQPGDRIVGVAFKSDDPEEPARHLFQKGKEFALTDDGFDWMFVFDRLQYVGPEVRVVLRYDRGGTEGTAELKPILSGVHQPDRGIALNMKKEIYTAESWSDALALGYRQTWEDAMRVVTFLKKLVTGGLSPMNLGGPLSIVYVAGSEASQGLPRLLMFLTFLSANLAVLNFMPIPALDGGHMLFLIAEGIRGKPVDERMQMALTLAGVACLLGLMIFVFGLDIHRLFL